MIAVNLKKTYRAVAAGHMDMDDATLGMWQGITDEAIEKFGDVIIGVYGDTVVSAYDITGHTRNAEGRVGFDGEESKEFAYLLNRKSPVKPWVRGQARPVQYIYTDTVRTGDAPVIEDKEGNRRAIVNGYVLTVDVEGHAYVEPPVGGVVTVTAAGSTGTLMSSPIEPSRD